MPMAMWHYRFTANQKWKLLLTYLIWVTSGFILMWAVTKWRHKHPTPVLHSLHCCEPPPAAVVAQRRIVAHIQNVEFRQGHFVTQPKVNINKWKWIWAFLFIPCPYQIVLILNSSWIHSSWRHINIVMLYSVLEIKLHSELQGWC